MTVEVISTRYGASAVDALADAVARAKQGEPLRPVTVVVSANYAGVAARRALARRTGVIGVSFVTLYRLAELLAGPALAAGGRVPVSSPVVTTAARAALSEQPGLFAPVAQQPATIAAFRRVHRELRDLDDRQLAALAGSEPRAAAVVAIERKITHRLASHWFDETDLMTTAARLVRAGEAMPVGRVVLHLPQQLSSFGAGLLLALAERGDVTVLAGRTGDETGDRAIERVLARLGIDSSSRAPTPLPDVAAHTVVAEQVVAADPDDEVRTALRRVAAAADAGTPLERIVITYAPAAPYGRLLADHLQNAHVPWNGVATVPLAERVAGRVLMKAIDLEPATLSRRDLFGVLSSLPPMRDRPVAVWERHSRRAGVVAGAQQWEERLGRLSGELRARGADTDEPWPARQADEIDALRTFVSDLAEALQPPTIPTWAAYARWGRRVQELLIGTERNRASWVADEERAAEQVERALDRLGRLDTVADLRVDVGTFRASLEAELEQSAGTIGRLGEGLFVGPIPLAVGIDADLVIVLGLIEGGLPGGLHDDPLLSDASRAVTSGVMTARERRELLHHQLLAVTGGAGTTVVASRPRADLRSGAGRYRSRWADAVLAPAERGPTRIHSTFVAGLDDGQPPASEQEALLRDLLALDAAGLPVERHPSARSDPPLHTALTLVAARLSPDFTEFDGNLAVISAEKAKLLPDRAISPTALEAWAACPFAYFVRYLLDVRAVENPEDELSIRPTDRGTLLHGVLEDVVGGALATSSLPGPDEDWPSAFLDDLEQSLTTASAEVVARGMVGRALHWRFDERRLRRLLDVFIDLDAQERSAYGVTPAAVELVFGREEPFLVQLPNGHAIAIAGKIDRVDASPSRVVVIDYKTGTKRSMDDLVTHERLQLPIYGLAARSLLDLPEAEVFGEYWHLHHVPKSRGRAALTVDHDAERRLYEIIETIIDGIAAGIFVLRPDPPDPWRPWITCAPCDPDGAGTATAWGQWQHKRGAPELRSFIDLIEPSDGTEPEDAVTP